LLLNSLGGASRTMIISCVTEASGSLTESLRTIHFSMSAARIRNRPIRYLDPQQKLILGLRDQIKRLKEENDRLKGTLSRDSSFYQESGGGGGGERNDKDITRGGGARSLPSGHEAYGFKAKRQSDPTPHSHLLEEQVLRAPTQPPPRDVNQSKSRPVNQPLAHISSQPTMTDYSPPISTLSQSQVSISQSL
jgi:hypothetical protein